MQFKLGSFAFLVSDWLFYSRGINDGLFPWALNFRKFRNGDRANGAKILWESFQKIQKLLNYRNEIHSTANFWSKIEWKKISGKKVLKM